jgi:hypothetical protein
MKWTDANKLDNWISMHDCVHGGLYRLASRNLCIGVYSLDRRGFVGVRTKFDDTFLFTEYHWDCGEPCGTAKPIDMLGQYPNDIVVEGEIRNGQWVENKDLMIWLDIRIKKTFTP